MPAITLTPADRARILRDIDKAGAHEKSPRLWKLIRAFVLEREEERLAVRHAARELADAADGLALADSAWDDGETNGLGALVVKRERMREILGPDPTPEELAADEVPAIVDLDA